MDLLLDTNIIIIYSRDNDVSKMIEDKHQIFTGRNRLFISVVTLGEIDAIIKKFKLGKGRAVPTSRIDRDRRYLTSFGLGCASLRGSI